MTEIKQTLLVKNHQVRLILPKEFNYKQINVVITPYEAKDSFSFEDSEFVPVNLKNNNSNFTSSILREERDLR